jgi:hypothetical protein
MMRRGPLADTPSHSRRMIRASFAITSRPHIKRAQGKPGARCTRSLACELKKHTSIVTTGSPVSPGLPCAMVLTVSFALSPVTGLFCHRRQWSCLRQLDASIGASGPHDFAVRARLRQRPRRALPVWAASPPKRQRRQKTAPLVSRRCRVHCIPHPTFVTTRTPL